MVTTKRRRRFKVRRLILLALVAGLIWGTVSLGAAVFRRLVPARGTGPVSAQTSVDELKSEEETIGEIIRSKESDGAARDSYSMWPTPGYNVITSEFGNRQHPILNAPVLHAGVDIGAPQGAKVQAFRNGRVILVDDLPAYGRIVVIDHGGQVASVYAHLSSVSVHEGQSVSRGAQVGKAGATGQVTGPHLHFEIRQDGEPTDPLQTIKPLN
jgi:murein DD-endopeptidase MepM/ murein hydrolase activator NlpD